MKVININGTSGRTCGCGSWLAHWKKIGGKDLPRYCPEKTCIKAPSVGAHVQRDDSSDRNWYIVPLCDAHNKKTNESLDLLEIKLVSANVSETCSKK